MARTQRIRRKELRQPDEFQTLSRRAFEYAEANRTAIYLATGAILLLLIAGLAYRALRSSREASAARAYGEAHALLDDRKYDEAAQAFQRAADSYGNSTYALLAQLQAANARLAGEQPAEAAAAYQKFLDAGPPTDDLRQLALIRLAQTREQEGNAEAARELYGSAAAIAGPFGEDALLGQARMAEQVGDAPQAKTLYEQFREKYPNTENRTLVTARLLSLGWTPPAEGGTEEGTEAAGEMEEAGETDEAAGDDADDHGDDE